MLRAMLRDTVTYTLPAMLSQGLGLILLPIYARVLTREEFGALDLIVSIAPIVTIVMSLEIQQGLARLRADANDEVRRRMTGTAWIASGCGFLVFVAVGLSAADALGLMVFGRDDFADTVRLGVLSWQRPPSTTWCSTSSVGSFAVARTPPSARSTHSWPSVSP